MNPCQIKRVTIFGYVRDYLVSKWKSYVNMGVSVTSIDIVYLLQLKKI